MKKRTILLILLTLAAALSAARWCLESKALPGASKGTGKDTGKDQAGPAKASPGERKVKYWADPMDPRIHVNHPGKAPCGMDLVPVYEPAAGAGEAGMPEPLEGLAQVDLSPWKQQLIGLRVAEAVKKPVVRIVRTVGRLAGGSGDFAAAAGDFTVRGQTFPARGRYVVADIYALDIPYVRAGQKAWVSALSGAGPRVEGLVAQIYPYDGTQSRVRQVRVLAQNLPSPELFVNVEIEADSQPVLSVPVDAVMATGLRQYVFVEKSPGVFEPREVTVGFQGDEDWQVTSGLSGGETVVVGANFMVDADSKLSANFSAMDAQGQ